MLSDTHCPASDRCGCMHGGFRCSQLLTFYTPNWSVSCCSASDKHMVGRKVVGNTQMEDCTNGGLYINSIFGEPIKNDYCYCQLLWFNCN